MRYRFYTVDVFTDRRFGGNQLAVLPDRFLEEEDQLRRTCAARSARGGSLTVDSAVLRIGPDGPIESDWKSSLENHACPPLE